MLNTHPDAIKLEPAPRRGAALDFMYASPGMTADVFVLNRVWQMLHCGDISLGDVAIPLRDEVCRDISQLREACTFNQVPYVNRPEGTWYLSFGGEMVNRAVALATEQSEWKATDVALCATKPIDWSSISSDPQAYGELFPLLFAQPTEQSLFQTLLPPNLQLQELLQGWLRDEVVAQVLSRLAHSEPVEIDERLALRFIPLLGDRVGGREPARPTAPQPVHRKGYCPSGAEPVK